MAAVDLLLSLGASIDATDRWGHTPLRDALDNSHMELALGLHRRRAHLLMSDVDMASRLCDMAKSGQVELLRCYLICGADASAADYDGRTALHIACSEGSRPVVEVLFPYIGDEHSPLDRFGNSPLLDAVRHGHHALALRLKELGFELRLHGAQLASKLCDAAMAGELAQLRTLAMCGADLNSADYDLRTALHIAASEGNTRVAQLLLEAGALPSPVDRFGNTPLADALRSGHAATAALLRAHGGALAAGAHGGDAYAWSQDEPIATLLRDLSAQCKWAPDDAAAVAAGIARWDTMMALVGDLRAMGGEAWAALSSSLTADEQVGPRLWGGRREGICREAVHAPAAVAHGAPPAAPSGGPGGDGEPDAR